jgi:hypothetical protein
MRKVVMVARVAEGRMDKRVGREGMAETRRDTAMERTAKMAQGAESKSQVLEMIDGV